MSAPEFANMSNCASCNVSFGLFTRKHHCRNCGLTFCGDCSNYNISIPKFDLHQPVRVCKKCYTALQKEIEQPKQEQKSVEKAKEVAAPQQAAAAPVAEEVAAPAKVVSNCKCGMPLCICPPDVLQEKAVASPQKEKKAAGMQDKASHKSASPSAPNKSQSERVGFFNSFGASSSSKVQYDFNGNLNEQCREAIKAGDNDGAIKLIEAGASASYVDHTGSSLLHVAAIFNREEVCLLLLSKGANAYLKNPAGETPIDLALPALAFKMKKSSTS